MTQERHHSFLLPEIIIHISQYLKKNSLFSCLLVNKSWYICFLPSLWRNIFVSVGKPAKTSGPSPEQLERHRQYVFRLTLMNIRPNNYSFHFPNLLDLEIARFQTTSEIYEVGDNHLEILGLNPSIVNLKLSDSIACPTLANWESIFRYPRLTNLTISRGVLKDLYCLEVFWKICEKLSVLRVADALSAPKSFMIGVDLSRMRKLYLETDTLTEEEAVDLIMRCKGLETLHYDTIPNICKNFQTEGWPRIRDFSVMDEVDDEEISIAVKGMHQITSLACLGLSLGQLTFQALQPHFSSITELDIGHLDERTDMFALEILSSVPQLRKFRGDTVSARDVVSGHPWVCHSIRDLSMRILFENTENDLHAQVFMRISELVHLRTLEAGENYFGLDGTYRFVGLKFGFAYGVKSISTLKKLERIQVRWTYQDIMSEEAEWMERNLKSLVTFEGYSGHINSRIKFYI